MFFDSNVLFSELGHIKLYADMIIQFDNEFSEDFQRGTPKWWDDYILKNIQIDDYYVYFICSCTLSKGQYNRVTDYKKVWGLNGINRGSYDNTYMRGDEKTYFGIVKTEGEQAFQSNTSSTIYLVKKNVEIVYEDVFEIFKEHKYNFRNMSDSDCIVPKCLVDLYKDSLLFRYNSIHGMSLEIFGEGIEKKYVDLDVTKYDGSKYDVIYRKA